MFSVEISCNRTSEYQYYVLGLLNKNKYVIILIDTGSPLSYICKNKIPELREKQARNPLRIKNKELDKEVNVNIKLSKHLEYKIDLYYGSLESSEFYDILLGVDFLDKQIYKITKKNLIIEIEEDTEIQIPRIELRIEEIENRI